MKHESHRKGNGHDLISAGTVTGRSVRSPRDEDLGKIEEIMLDGSTGQIAYAVLSFGGFLGMGNKLFAVPWDALSMGGEDDNFILNAEQEALEEAPGFDKDNWPDFADQQWGERIHTHYGSTPYWQR
jgi:uncharacterized protein YrrD